MANNTPTITSYDPDDLKQSLIDYIKTKPGWGDVDHEGSTFNTIIDLLVRNTHYIAYMASMETNESFLSTAQLRDMVIAHAQKLSYIPKSKTASTAVVSINAIPAQTPPTDKTIVTCAKGSVFLHSADNVTYSFTNTENVNLYKNEDGVFFASGVELKQGQFISQTLSYNDTTKKVTIPNKNIDTSTLRVFIRDNESDQTRTEYKKAENIDELSPDTATYFLTAERGGLYAIEFGNNILGVEPSSDAVVEVEYVSTEPDIGNGVTDLVCASSIGGYSNITVDVTTESFGGSEEESLDRIKFLAPKSYQTQNRAVREKDYVVLILQNFTFVKSATAWGGEKNNPPRYGKCMISVIPTAGFTIADNVKETIINFLDGVNVGSITPEIVDPEYIGVDVNVRFGYDRSKTSRTFNDLSAEVANIVEQYSDRELMDFDKYFNNSRLESLIMDVPGIEVVEIEKDIKTTLDTVNGNARYAFAFDNQIVPGSLTTDSFVLDIEADEQLIYDDGAGNIVYEKVVNQITSTRNIGTIDYENGAVDFIAAFVGDKNSITVKVKPHYDVVDSSQRRVLHVSSVTTQNITR